MSDIETTHLGFKIRYAENEEVWRCWDLEMQHASLNKLKAKIAAHERKYRKPAESFEVWHGAAWGGGDIKRAWVVSIDRDGKRCWVMHAAPGGDGKRQRVKTDIAALFPITPENDEAVAEILRQAAISSEAQEKMRLANKGIVRFDRDTLTAAAPSLETEE